MGKTNVVSPGYYQHFKGNVYKVIGVAKNTETLEEKVIYCDINGQMWERPITMWHDLIEGTPRFKKLNRE